jgi:hypothetical protein
MLIFSVKIMCGFEYLAFSIEVTEAISVVRIEIASLPPSVLCPFV